MILIKPFNNLCEKARLRRGVIDDVCMSVCIRCNPASGCQTQYINQSINQSRHCASKTVNFR